MINIEDLPHYFCVQCEIYHINLIFVVSENPSVFEQHWKNRISTVLSHEGSFTPEHIDVILDGLESQLKFEPHGMTHPFQSAGMVVPLTPVAPYRKTFVVFINSNLGFNDGRHVGVIAHELYHVARAIIRETGVKEAPETAGEATAYLLSHLIEKIWPLLVKAGYPFKKD